jgi:VIT1/CCC1 family predicted Fe2+/Mn2+ transporter
MLQASGDKGFNRLFWQAYKDKKTQPKDVFDRLEHFEQELASYGVAETSEGCTRIEQQEDRIKLYASLVGAERWPYVKEPVVLEHDAKCRLLVERLRGDGNLTLSNARYWFLTYDNKLPRFAKRVPDNGDEVPEMPFCISPSAWVQIVRALTPRTDDFERTVVDLLTSPFVGYRRAVNPNVVQEVVGRMDHMEDASPEMAVAVLTDTAAITEIEKAVATGEEEVVEEKIRVVYNSKVREMQDALETNERRILEMQTALEAAEQRVETARGAEREGAEVELAQARDAWEDEKATLKADLSAVKHDRKAAGERADQADKRIATMELRIEDDDARRKRARRIAAGLLLICLGVAVALVASLVIFSDAWAIGAGIVAGTVLSVLGARIAVGKAWGGEVVSLGSLVCAVAAIVVAVILDSN